MRKKVTGIILSALLVAVLLLTACKNYPVPSPLYSAVPEEADLLVGIQVAEILEDDDFRDIYEELAANNPDMPPTVDEALDSIKQETQIDLTDFQEAIIFADTSAAAGLMASAAGQDSLYYGAIFKGSLARTRSLLAVGGNLAEEFRNYEHNGVSVYRYTGEEDTTISLAFINNEVLIAGSTAAVEDAIDVVRGEKQAISGTIYDFYEGLGENLVKIAYLVPDGQTGLIPQTTDVEGYEIDLSSLREINSIGLTVYKADSSITTRLHTQHSSPDAARDTEELVNNLIYLSEQETLEPEIEELLDRLEVSVSDSVLILEIIETVAELEDYLKSLPD